MFVKIYIMNIGFWTFRIFEQDSELGSTKLNKYWTNVLQMQSEWKIYQTNIYKIENTTTTQKLSISTKEMKNNQKNEKTS